MVESSGYEDSYVHRNILCSTVSSDPFAVLGQGYAPEPDWSDCPACHSPGGLVFGGDAATSLFPAAQLARKLGYASIYFHNVSRPAARTPLLLLSLKNDGRIWRDNDERSHPRARQSYQSEYRSCRQAGARGAAASHSYRTSERYDY
jgi:hypothetical protein